VTRPQTKHPHYFYDRWFPKLATTLLVGSILQHSSVGVAQVKSEAALRPPLLNQATYTYSDPLSGYSFQGNSVLLNVAPDRLVDPLGRILGCGGQLLPDYAGFSVSLYETNPADLTQTELGNLAPLTATELPDIPNNGVSGGANPNRENKNPFLLSNAVEEGNRGVYNFLLDPSKGQLNPGRTYIFVVSPPANSIYQQRRVKIQIIDSTGTAGNNVVRYVATSLDGQPISTSGNTRIEGTVVGVANAELIGLDLLAFQFTTQLCQPDQAQIVKTGDRAAAEPGDSVIYRLSIKSRSDADLTDVTLTDTLPLGFRFLPKSVRGEIAGQIVPVTVETSGSTVIFRSPTPIPSGSVLNVAYAAQLTPDAIRGSGRNSAIMSAKRSDNGFGIQDGPATHQLRIRQGILSDCGILIGRVFIDKNFDGEQQPGEPGVPNAVIFFG
jgi:uncharacterized repeat protein (TIGR01451 family)